LLVKHTNSWWNGGNIYGKKTQMLTFPAGIDVYEKICREKLDKWEGFRIVKEANGTETGTRRNGVTAKKRRVEAY
jgi:hypothetical protein